MKLLKTKAIALHHTRYSDNSVIARMFTRDLGLRACLIRSVYKRKSGKTNLIRPFTLLDLEVKHSDRSEILNVSHIERSCPQSGFQGEFSKSAVVMFLSEVLYKSLEESYVNENLFDFVWHAIRVLDLEEHHINFHLVFLVELAKHYGMFPQLPRGPGDQYFDLEAGTYKDHKSGNYCLDQKQSELILQILGTKFDGMKSLEISGAERKQAIRILLDYLRLHVSGLNEINSQAVLETVFHG